MELRPVAWTCVINGERADRGRAAVGMRGGGAILSDSSFLSAAKVQKTTNTRIFSEAVVHYTRLYTSLARHYIEPIDSM